MSSSENDFHIICPLWVESTSYWWIPLTKGHWCRPLMLPLMLDPISCWTNMQVAGDFRKYNSHATPWFQHVSTIHGALTTWMLFCWDNMDVILQKKFTLIFTIWNLLYIYLNLWKKNNIWNLSWTVKLVIHQHWIRYWLGTKQATSHYLYQWWPIYLTPISSHLAPMS